MELFTSTHEPKSNLSIKCKISTKQTFLKLCDETGLNQSDFFESAILLLNNPTNANWKQWQKVYQNCQNNFNQKTKKTDQLNEKINEIKENLIKQETLKNDYKSF